MIKQDQLTTHNSSDLQVLLKPEYLKSISRIEKSAQHQKKYKFIPNKKSTTELLLLFTFMTPFLLCLITMILGGILDMSRDFIGGIALLSGASLCGGLAIAVDSSVFDYICGKVYKTDYDLSVNIPGLASIEKEYVGDNVLLKIVDREGDVIREQVFSLAQEALLLEAIVEWENELIDFMDDNETILGNIQESIINQQKVVEEHKVLVDQHIISSNQRLLAK